MGFFRLFRPQKSATPTEAPVEEPTASAEQAEAPRPDETPTPLSCLESNRTYTVRDIDTADDQMNAFLLRLGCYPGEQITLLTRTKKLCVVSIKGSRYSIDSQLAEAILV